MTDHPTTELPHVDKLAELRAEAAVRMRERELRAYLDGTVISDLRDLTQSIAFDKELNDGWDLSLSCVLSYTRKAHEPRRNEKIVANIKENRGIE